METNLVLTLHIMRHAKSDWSGAGLTDKERPLNERGLEAAARMGDWMQRKDIIPDIVLCSSAIRTQQTLDAIVSAGVRARHQVILDDLYLASTRTAIQLIKQHGGTNQSIMLVGHNPTSHELAAGLAYTNPAKADPLLLSRLANRFPTGALASFEVDANIWKDCDTLSGRLLRFIRPKDIV